MKKNLKFTKEDLKNIGFKEEAPESTQMAFIYYLVKDSKGPTISANKHMLKKHTKKKVFCKSGQQLSFPDDILKGESRKKCKAS